jgi:hypothetical protein
MPEIMTLTQKIHQSQLWSAPRRINWKFSSKKTQQVFMASDVSADNNKLAQFVHYYFRTSWESFYVPQSLSGSGARSRGTDTHLRELSLTQCQGSQRNGLLGIHAHPFMMLCKSPCAFVFNLGKGIREMIDVAPHRRVKDRGVDHIW